VFAHRGLALEAPENTLLAFARAISAGALYVETDVHASLDGVAVITHDPDLKRIAGRDIRVSQLTMSELRRIDLGHGQNFVSLAEALDAFPETRFNIDMKIAAAVPGAVSAILAANASRRVLVSSFSEARSAAALRELPGVPTSASARRFAVSLFAGKVGLPRSLKLSLRGVAAVQIPEKALGLKVTTERMIRRLHSAGVEVHVWTVNDPQRMRELLSLGVDGLITDRADLAISVVAER
jgi:glycerophosphoryl diester phosphodiesterase